ncbi:hypothetical protein [Larkinella soli]|uniref:hypothetical protein n=1 Tax=Larkinella soli TaxID=1770527 RepID=UPI000FFC1530|nr:hypothetical protein [Larkinella soli]
MTKYKAAALGLISILSLALLFHFVVLAGFIPYRNVWGGRLQSREEMVVFETASILLNSLFLWAVLVKTGYLRNALSDRVPNFVLWAMVVLFALNTVGNLFAVQPLERYIATPLTLLLSVLSLVVVRQTPKAV